MNIADQIKKDLRNISDPKKVEVLSHYFKTGEGEYGHGDKFLGIKLPDQRIVAKKYFKEASLKDVEELLKDPTHEFRLTGVIILTMKYPKATPEEKKEIYCCKVTTKELKSTTKPER